MSRFTRILKISALDTPNEISDEERKKYESGDFDDFDDEEEGEDFDDEEEGEDFDDGAEDDESKSDEPESDEPKEPKKPVFPSVEESLTDEERAELLRSDEKIKSMRERGVDLFSSIQMTRRKDIHSKQVKSIKSEVILKRQKDNDLPNYWECPRCGLPESSQFVDAIQCPNCEETPPATSKFCPACNTELPEGDIELAVPGPISTWECMPCLNKLDAVKKKLLAFYASPDVEVIPDDVKSKLRPLVKIIGITAKGITGDKKNAILDAREKAANEGFAILDKYTGDVPLPTNKDTNYVDPTSQELAELTDQLMAQWEQENKERKEEWDREDHITEEKFWPTPKPDPLRVFKAKQITGPSVSTSDFMRWEQLLNAEESEIWEIYLRAGPEGFEKEITKTPKYEGVELVKKCPRCFQSLPLAANECKRCEKNNVRNMELKRYMFTGLKAGASMKNAVKLIRAVYQKFGPKEGVVPDEQSLMESLKNISNDTPLDLDFPIRKGQLRYFINDYLPELEKMLATTVYDLSYKFTIHQDDWIDGKRDLFSKEENDIIQAYVSRDWLVDSSNVKKAHGLTQAGKHASTFGGLPIGSVRVQNKKAQLEENPRFDKNGILTTFQVVSMVMGFNTVKDRIGRGGIEPGQIEIPHAPFISIKVCPKLTCALDNSPDADVCKNCNTSLAGIPQRKMMFNAINNLTDSALHEQRWEFANKKSETRIKYREMSDGVIAELLGAKVKACPSCFELSKTDDECSECGYDKLFKTGYGIKPLNTFSSDMSLALWSRNQIMGYFDKLTDKEELTGTEMEYLKAIDTISFHSSTLSRESTDLDRNSYQLSRFQRPFDEWACTHPTIISSMEKHTVKICPKCKKEYNAATATACSNTECNTNKVIKSRGIKKTISEPYSLKDVPAIVPDEKLKEIMSAVRDNKFIKDDVSSIPGIEGLVLAPDELGQIGKIIKKCEQVYGSLLQKAGEVKFRKDYKNLSALERKEISEWINPLMVLGKVRHYLKKNEIAKSAIKGLSQIDPKTGKPYYLSVRSYIKFLRENVEIASEGMTEKRTKLKEAQKTMEDLRKQLFPAPKNASLRFKMISKLSALNVSKEKRKMMKTPVEILLTKPLISLNPADQRRYRELIESKQEELAKKEFDKSFSELDPDEKSEISRQKDKWLHEEKREAFNKVRRDETTRRHLSRSMYDKSFSDLEYEQQNIINNQLGKDWELIESKQEELAKKEFDKSFSELDPDERSEISRQKDEWFHEEKRKAFKEELIDRGEKGKKYLTEDEIILERKRNEIAQSWFGVDYNKLSSDRKTMIKTKTETEKKEVAKTNISVESIPPEEKIVRLINILEGKEIISWDDLPSEFGEMDLDQKVQFLAEAFIDIIGSDIYHMTIPGKDGNPKKVPNAKYLKSYFSNSDVDINNKIKVLSLISVKDSDADRFISSKMDQKDKERDKGLDFEDDMYRIDEITEKNICQSCGAESELTSDTCSNTECQEHLNYKPCPDCGQRNLMTSDSCTGCKSEIGNIASALVKDAYRITEKVGAKCDSGSGGEPCEAFEEHRSCVHVKSPQCTKGDYGEPCQMFKRIGTCNHIPKRKQFSNFFVTTQMRNETGTDLSCFQYGYDTTQSTKLVVKICPNCKENTFGENAVECRKCKEDISGLNNNTKICPSCGEENIKKGRKKLEKCKKCKGDISGFGLRYIPRPRLTRKPKGSSEKKVCKHPIKINKHMYECGAHNPPNEEECKKCGNKLNYKSCPDCGEMNPLDSDKCLDKKCQADIINIPNTITPKTTIENRLHWKGKIKVFKKCPDCETSNFGYAFKCRNCGKTNIKDVEPEFKMPENMCIHMRVALKEIEMPKGRWRYFNYDEIKAQVEKMQMPVQHEARRFDEIKKYASKKKH